MQRIQINAECIVLYASQRVELKYIERMMGDIRKSMLIGSISFAFVNFPIQLLSKSKKSFLTDDANEMYEFSSSCSQWNVYIHYAHCSVFLRSTNTKSGTRPDIFEYKTRIYI
jgi:hypothetical protein